MGATRFGNVGVIGAVTLLLVSVLAPVAGAQEAYARIAGTWVGPVAWPSGSSEITTWTINKDGSFSIQTDAYTAQGNLQPKGKDYAFAYEWEGKTYKGVLATPQSSGKKQLVGRGEDAYGGPMSISLTPR